MGGSRRRTMTKPWTRRTWAALVASAIVVSSATALAQTPPPPEAAPAPPSPEVTPPPPPPAVVAPAPPPAAETFPKFANNMLMLTKDAGIRVGLQLQTWVDFLQAGSGAAPAATDGSYALNFLLRRARILVAANINKDINMFFQLDAPRLGTGTTA